MRLDWLFRGFEALVEALRPKAPPGVPAPAVVPAPAPIMAPPAVVVPPAPKYLWDTQANTRHSVRVICDEEGLSLNDKDIITACIQQESQFLNSAVCKNRDKTTGQVWSTDWGICQINDFYHIGPKKDFPSVQYVLENPDAAVHYMIKMKKAGHLSMWVSFSSGAYLRYMPK